MFLKRKKKIVYLYREKQTDEKQKKIFPSPRANVEKQKKKFTDVKLEILHDDNCLGILPCCPPECHRYATPEFFFPKAIDGS